MTTPCPDSAVQPPAPSSGLPSGLAPVDANTFKSIFRRHPAGVAVVTVSDGETPYGFTATSVISVSANPAMLAFSIDSGSSSWPALAAAETVVINFLDADQVDLSARFATRGIDRFRGTEWSRLPTGEPVLAGSAAWIRGRIVSRTPVGTSFLVLVAAEESEQTGSPAPLVYHDRGYHRVDDDTAI